MKRVILSIAIQVFSLSILFISSCNKEEVVDSATSDIVDKAAFTVDSTTNTGKFGCFELVFPVSFTMPDGSSLTVNSDDELKSALKSYVESNKQKGKKCDSLRPKIVLPITIITASGETKLISTEAELKALRDSCHNDYFDKREHCKGHADNRKPCFKLNFPVTVLLPDSTTQTVANNDALKSILKAWKDNHPTSNARPELSFPLSVTKKDGTVVTVNSKEELKALKDSCK